MDVNNPEEVKERVIRPFIVPYFQIYDKASQDIYRDSFQYYLNQEPALDRTGKRDVFDLMFADADLTFEPPTPPRLFFVWIWEEVFGPGDYHLDSTSNFVVDNDRRYYAPLQPDNTHHLTLITDP